MKDTHTPTMLPTSLTISAFLLLVFSLAGCTGSPAPAPAKNDPWNSADSQRSRAQQTQDELSAEKDRKK